MSIIVPSTFLDIVRRTLLPCYFEKVVSGDLESSLVLVVSNIQHKCRLIIYIRSMRKNLLIVSVVKC